MEFQTLLILHALATWAMFGLIWMVQLVHYPSFLQIDRERFRSFAKFHVDRISFIVVPLMFLELFTGVGLCLIPGVESNRIWFVIGFILIVILWLVTALTSVPLHRRLLQGVDEGSIRRLIAWNWVRTSLWTIRTAGLTWILWSQT